MRVFISWSGPLSQALGQAIAGWLPRFLQAAKPFFSPDIDKGGRWLQSVTMGLNESHIGIIVVTPDNRTSPWLTFEAGVIAAKLDAALVCPVVFGLKPTDVQGPLSQFQMTKFEKEDFRKLCVSINKAIEQPLADDVLDDAFDMWWPKLEETLSKLLAEDAAKRTDPPVERQQSDMVEEILELVRNRQPDPALAAMLPAIVEISTSLGDIKSMQRELLSYTGGPSPNRQMLISIAVILTLEDTSPEAVKRTAEAVMQTSPESAVTVHEDNTIRVTIAPAPPAGFELDTEEFARIPNVKAVSIKDGRVFTTKQSSSRRADTITSAFREYLESSLMKDQKSWNTLMFKDMSNLRE